MESTQAAVPGGWPRPVLRIVGAGLLTATAAIHLDLYLTGFKNIPTIGPLFLLQVIAGFVLAAAVLATGHPLAAAAGAGFAVATLGGYLLSIWVGLFGFTEVRTTAGIVAGIIEVAAFATLALLAVALPPGRQPEGGGPVRALAKLLAGLPMKLPGIGALSALALVLLIVAVAGASSNGATGSGALKTGTAGGATVLTNAKGFTVYWFAADSPGKSNCYGSCAQYWPPVTGKASAPAGIPGTVATITRTGGKTQVTYNGRPLYTYVGDTAPGQARGNNLNLNGGLWHEIVVP